MLVNFFNLAKKILAYTTQLLYNKKYDLSETAFNIRSS